MSETDGPTGQVPVAPDAVRPPADPAPRDTAGPRVVLLSVLLACLGGALLWVLDTDRAPGGPGIHLIALIAMFAVAELVVLHIQVQREAQTVSIAEVPLVLGLFLSSPLELLLARVVGSFLVVVLHRRSSPIKTLFNMALVVAETGVVLAVFGAVAGDSADLAPLTWGAAALAVACGTVTSVWALSVVIGIYEGRPTVRQVVVESVQALAVPLMLTTLTLVGVTTLAADAASGWLLGAAAAVLVAAYRAYASLWDRHLSLERLYQFSQVVGSSPEVDEVLRNVLVQAKDLLRSEQAEVVFFSDDETRAAVVTLQTTGRFTRREETVRDAPWLQRLRLARESSALMPRGTNDLADRHFLADRGLRESVIVPLRNGPRAHAVLLVGDRLGEVRAFDQSDVLLLETVANHAAVALQNGHLIDRLRHDALHDALTNLPNRTALQRRLLEVLQSRGADQTFAVMVLDLDGFKEVNDSLGHQQGDRLLVEVAERFAAAIGDEGLTARLGGDEFAVVTVPTADQERVHRLARRLLAALELPISLDGLEVEVGASIGVALAPEHGQDPSSLLKAADMAMYLAKGSTGGVKLFEPQLGGQSTRRLFVVGELRQALHHDRLDVHVQPKASLTTGEVTSVEALVRWSHPELGAIGPAEFIPLAERSGLIQQLTTFVLETSVAACARWRTAGEDIGIAVNLSTRSLLDADVVNDVRKVLARHRVPASWLTLEITESAAMAEPGRAVAVLDQLRALGVRLSVDDFGTGYSSLSYLKRLPVDEVKIDRSFVKALSADGDDAAIVSSIISLGRHIGLQVVAEGIEDEATWQRLLEMGCAVGQGYYLGSPMPVDDFPGWLAAYRGRRGIRPAAASTGLLPG